MVAARAYLTGFGHYLPGPPVENDGIAARLGGDDPVTERIRRRILESNGIRQRHYALDEHGEPTELNEELAVKALRAALDDRGIEASDLRMLATATTMGDVLVPGFASMVHGRLGGGPMQLLSASGVCASSLAALDAAVSKIRLGDHPRAAVVGLRASEPQPAAAALRRLSAQAWTPTSCGGCSRTEPEPSSSSSSRIRRSPRCGSTGSGRSRSPTSTASACAPEWPATRPTVGSTWQDVSIADADAARHVRAAAGREHARRARPGRHPRSSRSSWTSG